MHGSTELSRMENVEAQTWGFSHTPKARQLSRVKSLRERRGLGSWKAVQAASSCLFRLA